MSPTDWPHTWHWRIGPVRPGPCVVFDVDGVISDASWRQHFLDGHPKRWDDFFGSCDQDPAIEETLRLMHALDADLGVVLLTARPLWVRDRSLEWFGRHLDRWDLLVMRDDDDDRLTRHFKLDVLEHLRRVGFDVRLALEDDLRNVEMYRANGVPCLYVHSGYYG